MSGILAAAQSSGCCCRPVEGCTCGDPNRPGAVFDRQLTAISVTGEVTVDHAIRLNGSPSVSCECPCSPVGGETYGSGAVRYGYRSPGSIVDPDGLVPEDPCYPGCTNGGCGGCPTYSVSANSGTVVCQQVFPGAPSWLSRNTQFGENIIGQWSWRGRQVGYCTSSQGVRVRSCCRFPFAGAGSQFGNLVVDSCGAFVDINTGTYVNTPYGATLGRLHAIQTAELITVPLCCGGPCHYEVSIGIGFMHTWSILQALAEDGFYAPTGGYSARYVKPCLSPSDTVFGRYEIVYVPDYDRYEVDQECGAIRYFEDLRVSFPNTIEVA